MAILAGADLHNDMKTTAETIHRRDTSTICAEALKLHCHVHAPPLSSPLLFGVRLGCVCPVR
jgi:hypothetical protein